MASDRPTGYGGYRDPAVSRQVSVCEQFSETLGISLASTHLGDGVCWNLTTRDIGPIRAKANGATLKTPHLNPIGFSFEGEGKDALVAGELVLLEEEYNAVNTGLTKQGIQVDAIHNHWIGVEPALYYIHFKTIDDPLKAAAKIRAVFDSITTKRTGKTITQSIKQGH